MPSGSNTSRSLSAASAEGGGGGGGGGGGRRRGRRRIARRLISRRTAVVGYFVQNDSRHRHPGDQLLDTARRRRWRRVVVIVRCVRRRRRCGGDGFLGCGRRRRRWRRRRRRGGGGKLLRCARRLRCRCAGDFLRCARRKRRVVLAGCVEREAKRMKVVGLPEPVGREQPRPGLHLPLRFPRRHIGFPRCHQAERLRRVRPQVNRHVIGPVRVEHGGERSPEPVGACREAVRIPEAREQFAGLSLGVRMERDQRQGQPVGGWALQVEFDAAEPVAPGGGSGGEALPDNGSGPRRRRLRLVGNEQQRRLEAGNGFLHLPDRGNGRRRQTGDGGNANASGRRHRGGGVRSTGNRELKYAGDVDAPATVVAKRPRHVLHAPFRGPRFVKTRRDAQAEDNPGIRFPVDNHVIGRIRFQQRIGRCLKRILADFEVIRIGKSGDKVTRHPRVVCMQRDERMAQCACRYEPQKQFDAVEAVAVGFRSGRETLRSDNVGWGRNRVWGTESGSVGGLR